MPEGQRARLPRSLASRAQRPERSAGSGADSRGTRRVACPHSRPLAAAGQHAACRARRPRADLARGHHRPAATSQRGPDSVNDRWGLVVRAALALARHETPALLTGRSRLPQGGPDLAAIRGDPARPGDALGQPRFNDDGRAGAPRASKSLAGARGVPARPSCSSQARGVDPGGRRARRRRGLHGGRQARSGARSCKIKSPSTSTSPVPQTVHGRRA